MPPRRQQLGGRQRGLHHRARGHDRDVVARVLDAGNAQRDRVLTLRHLAHQRVVQLVLDEDDRVVVADRGLQQALGVGRRGGHHDLQPGDVADPRLEALTVLGGRAARRTQRRAQHERHAQAAPRHVVRLGGLVDELVHHQRQEVAEHDVDDRPHAGHGGAHTQAGDAGLRDRRVDHSIGAELVDQAGQHLERRSRLGHVLADHEHPLVAPELLGQRLVDRLAEGDLAGGGGVRRRHAGRPR